MMLGMAVLLLSGCSGDGGETGGAPGAACQSNCPTAKAGPEQTVVTGAAVTLDGTGSTSGTLGLITYQWMLLSKPAGSAATLVGATTARPTFTADVVGTYDARLVVQEGGASSAPDTVRITCGTGNLVPIADAGPDRTELLGTPVTLDGTGSRDPNGTPITYAWRIVTQPSGSKAVLLNATSKTPSFTPQVAGPYTLALTVSDGALTSPSDEIVITVTANNCPPIADAGADQKVTTGQLVTLSGAGSTDPNHDPLTYSWRFQSKPDGSSATLAAPTAVSPTFTADMAGLYVLSLVVNDGKLTSAPDTVVINAVLPGSVNLVLEAYVKSSNPVGGAPSAPEFSPGDQFGYSVAISGDTLAVGAPTTESTNVGAVYVFTRTVGGWRQQAYIRAPNPGGRFFDNLIAIYGFGTSVALSGDTLAVGDAAEASCSTGVNSSPTGLCRYAGAVYIFTRTNGSWTQQAYVKASNTGGVPFAGFGGSLALTGDTLAVGASGEDSCGRGVNGDQTHTAGCDGTGAVYVFMRTAGVWSQQAYIKASNARNGIGGGDLFGTSLAVSGNTLVVGASGEDSCAPGINGDQANTGCEGAGAVYVFTRTNGLWTQEAYIKASNPGGAGGPVGPFDSGDGFGASVAISGDTLAVGSGEDSCALGINGDQMNNGCLGAGAVYVFTRTNGSWTQQAYVKASNRTTVGGFGRSLALNDDTLAVGNPAESSCALGVNGNQTNTEACNHTGAVYIFKRAGGVWSQSFYVKASNPDSNDEFGWSVALDSHTVVVGAPGESSCAAGVNGNQADNNCYAAGAAYVYASQ